MAQPLLWESNPWQEHNLEKCICPQKLPTFFPSHKERCTWDLNIQINTSYCFLYPYQCQVALGPLFTDSQPHSSLHIPFLSHPSYSVCKTYGKFCGTHRSWKGKPMEKHVRTRGLYVRDNNAIISGFLLFVCVRSYSLLVPTLFYVG